MNPRAADFVHPAHLQYLVEAANTFGCHILVRETGRASLGWVGRSGYTGKRADMKANTANRDVGDYRLAGLVCAPHLQPRAFTPARLGKAQVNWQKSSHLITAPNHRSGIDDKTQPIGCRTPYILQTNPGHRHFGCIALVEMGLLTPRYVHGDYDLFAIIPAGRAFDPDRLAPRAGSLGSTMSLSHLGLEERIAQERALMVDNMTGPLSFRLANFVNNRINQAGGDLLGALMINHGEQLNVPSMRDFQRVLVISPSRGAADPVHILEGRAAHEHFYRNA